MSKILQGCRVLIAEDEYIIAADLEDALVGEGAEIVGPFSTVEAALAALRDGVTLHAAVLDLDLRGEMSFPIAEELDRYAVPFLFSTGFEEALPHEFKNRPCLSKPVQAIDVAHIIEGMLEGGS